MKYMKMIYFQYDNIHPQTPLIWLCRYGTRSFNHHEYHLPRAR